MCIVKHPLSLADGERISLHLRGRGTTKWWKEFLSPLTAKPLFYKEVTMIVAAIILFVIAASAFVMSILSFMEKGFLFNNAYIYASKEMRAKLNKKPHYRQSAIVFLLIGLIFLLNGFSVIFETKWIFYAVIAVVVIAMVYAIVSSVRIEKNKKR